MEKFTNWRDKGTGIAPFLPPTVGNPSFASQLGCTIIFIFKCIILLPVVILYKITASKVIGSWMLSFLFNWKIDVNVQGVKRRELNKAAHYPQRDGIYICNSSSALDAFVLDMIAQGPSWFLIPFENVLYKMDKEQYMNFALDGSLNVKRYGKEVSSIGQLKNSVVFVFPEGTCSNGKSVLPFSITEVALKEFIDPSDHRISRPLQTIQLKVNGSLVTPLSLSKYKFFSRMLAKGVHIKVKIHEKQQITPFENLRISLNDGDKFKLVSKSLNVESKIKFVEEYTSSATNRR